jgi:hypothetical protein
MNNFNILSLDLLLNWQERGRGFQGSLYALQTAQVLYRSRVVTVTDVSEELTATFSYLDPEVAASTS